MITPSAQVGSSLQLRAYRPDLAGKPAAESAVLQGGGPRAEESETELRPNAQDGRKGQRLDIYG